MAADTELVAILRGSLRVAPQDEAIEISWTPSSNPRSPIGAPRFVANGVALTDFEEVTASVATWDDWCRAWSDRAAQHEAMGREALAAKKFISAGEHLQRAGVYYHFGKFLFVHDVPQMKAAHMKAVACRNAALPHLNPPGERVTIPYEGKALYGILRKPNGVDEAAGADHGGRARLGQGGDRRLRAAVSRSRHRDAGVRRAGAGRGRVRFRDPRRLRGRREGGGRLRDDAQRSRHRRASACGASASAATTRRAPRRSRSASRPASRSAGRTTGRSTGTACRN